MAKSHKAMSDGEWLARLQKFASSGVWPSGEGNRPAPRQKRWHELYLKIEKCPLQSRGQVTLWLKSPTCSCGFHKGHPPANPPTSQSYTREDTVTVQGSAVDTSAVGTVVRPKMTLSMFEKSRFGGSHVASAKPNVNVQRKPTQAPPSPSPSKSTSAAVNPQPSPALRPIIQPSSSFLLPPATETSSAGPDLPLLWPQSMPKEDHKWVAEVLFRVNVKGKME
ncbi:uncharacterized protein LOC134468232, partial [Engraulis encrasicolus]|uniref:uncharacterized protein LOC134468232 n=1 Tax=Engraulis encrasicolus TaxID=184585 RepID=UPI002FD4B252